MRHINMNYDLREAIINSPVDERELTEMADRKFEGKVAICEFDNGIKLQAFKYVQGEEVYFIPEPDPIVIYFDAAIHFHKSIEKFRGVLFSEKKYSKYNAIALSGDFNAYFAVVCSYTLFLFLALEAFVNRMIPTGFEYKKTIQDKRTEIYNKDQIQRNIQFLEKIKYVLPEITGRNFAREFGDKYETIMKLKNFRDEVVHTKSFEGVGSPNFYENLFISSLDFDHNKALLDARDFINYFQAGLIEECNCGKDE